MVMSAEKFDGYVEEEVGLEAEQSTSTYHAPICLV